MENPFRPTRFEHHEKPLIWLSKHGIQLQARRSFYVNGSRGSGKTSLLQALHWRERQNNESLKLQLSEKSASQFLAVYFRIPDHISLALGRLNWELLLGPGYNANATAANFFIKLIEFTALGLLCEAIEEYRILGHLELEASVVDEVIEKFLTRVPSLKNFSSRPIKSILELGLAFKSAANEINFSAIDGTALEKLRMLPPDAPHVLLNDFAKMILVGKEGLGARKFHLKVCMDDCELLSRPQQIALNDLVRLAKDPIFWIISYVGNTFDATSGSHSSYNLSITDRQVINLDMSKKADFIQLCEAVSSLRYFYSLDEERRSLVLSRGLGADQLFSTKTILGEYDLNCFIEEHLINKDRAVSDGFEFIEKIARDLQALAKNEPATKKSGLFSEKNISIGQCPPYYQAFIMDRLYHRKLRPNSSETITLRTLKKMLPILRRKMRSAMIMMSNEFRFLPLAYRGQEVIVGLSDGCIRDFLEMMAEIFDEEVKRPEEAINFFERSKPISNVIQRKSFQKASKGKLIGITNAVNSHAAELTRLVECLGELTAILQRDIRTAERGIFVLDDFSLLAASPMSTQAQREKILRVLERGEIDGLLRSDTEEVPFADLRKSRRHSEPISKKFRLHRRFAPYFGFSFRGPYEPIKLPIGFLVKICEAPDLVEPKAWAAETFKSIRNVEDNLELFK